jgi:hypothetical protein
MVIKKTNPVKKNMDKFHKPSTHKDKTKYDRKSESERLQDELEPIIHPTEYDESDDLEYAKRIIPPQPEKVNQPFNGGKGG